MLRPPHPLAVAAATAAAPFPEQVREALLPERPEQPDRTRDRAAAQVQDATRTALALAPGAAPAAPL